MTDPDPDPDPDQYRGIYGIPATPFHEDDTLDTRSLESVLHFSVENGCHGIVMPVMASEYHSLTDVERKQVFDITTKVVNKRIPTVAGITGVPENIRQAGPRSFRIQQNQVARRWH